MQAQTVEKARAVVGRTTAQIQNHQVEEYHSHVSASRANLLRQAADVLCLLSSSPMSATERVGYLALLQRRLQRAYAEGRA